MSPLSIDRIYLPSFPQHFSLPEWPTSGPSTNHDWRMHMLMCAVHVHHPGDIWLTFSRSEVRSLSHVQLFAASWTVAHQAPLSMGFSRHELLEWVAISFSRGSSWPRDRTQVSHMTGRCFTIWAPREVLKEKEGQPTAQLLCRSCYFSINSQSMLCLRKVIQGLPWCQWLRIHLAMQGTWVRSLAGKLNSHMLQSN